MDLLRRFDPTKTPILWFNPEPRIDGPVRYLLWPVYAYRVIAPSHTHKEINLFQQAVLGLCQAGIRDLESISDYLHLDRELVKFILRELKNEQYLEDKHIVTKSGMSVLSQETDQITNQYTPGYVFQDPWQQKIWPRVVKELLLVEATFENEGSDFPTLHPGSAGRPRLIRPWVIDTNQGIIEPTTPTAAEIYQASRQYAKESKHGRLLKTYEAEEFEEELDKNYPLDAMNVNRISFINPIPEPYYVTIGVYLLKSEWKGTWWYTWDPMGICPSPWMYRLVSPHSEEKKDKNFYQFINGFVSKEASKPKVIKTRNELDEWSELVDAELGNRFKHTTILNTDLYEHIKQMEVAFNLLDEKENMDQRRKGREFIDQACYVLESIFRKLINNNTNKKAWIIYDLDTYKDRNDILNFIASNLKFTIPMSTSFAGIKASKVKESMALGFGTLRERSIAVLLAAYHDQNHPIRAIAQQHPDFFYELDEIIKIRGERAAHESDKSINKEEIEKTRQFVYKTIAKIYSTEQKEEANGTHER